NEWPKAAEDIERYRQIASGVGHAPRPPIILTNVSCAESRDEARARGMQYLSRKWDSIDRHYHFSDGHLATVKGYEFYGKMAKTYGKMKDERFRQKATDFYVSIQIVGTPDECLQQVRELHRLTGLDHLITEFAFGGMPHEESEINMRLFADRVMPVLQRDPAFASAGAGAGVEARSASDMRSGGVFAPALARASRWSSATSPAWRSRPSSTRPTSGCWAAAASTARSIGRPGPSCSTRVAPWRRCVRAFAVLPGRAGSRRASGCRPVTAFPPSRRCGAAEPR